MKTLKIILLAFCLGFVFQGHSQILKKLGKKVSKTAERTLERKVEQKTENETEKAFDSTFNNPNTTKEDKSSPFDMTASKVDPEDTYSFTHKYVMEVKSDKNTTNLHYYLTNSGNYMGSTVPDKNGEEDLITVMDLDRKAMFMFMENKGDKSQMSMNLDIEEIADDAMEESDMKITPTGNTKTILGYTCNEFKVVGKDLTGTIWVTQDAGISFAKSFYSVKAKKGMSQSWMKLINGLTMQMDMVDTSKRKPQNISMTCISLEKTSLNIESNEYKKLM